MPKIDRTTQDTNTPPEMLSWFTVRTFAQAAGISERTVRSWIRNGTISAERVGPRLLRIPSAELSRVTSPAGLNAYLGN